MRDSRQVSRDRDMVSGKNSPRGSETAMSDPVILVADEITEDQRLAITAPLGEFSAARGFAFRAVALAYCCGRTTASLVASSGIPTGTGYTLRFSPLRRIYAIAAMEGGLWRGPKKSHATATALELGSIPTASNRRASISVSATAFSAPCRATPDPSSVSCS
jgi:hypothetical protein